MKYKVIAILIVSFVAVPFWVSLAYKAQPLIYYFCGEEIAQHIYSDEIEWMKGKKSDEIEARFGSFDHNSYEEGELYYLTDGIFLKKRYPDSPTVVIRSVYKDEMERTPGDCVFSFAKNFQPRWVWGNLILSLLFFCGAPMIFVWLTHNYHRKPSPTP